MSADQIPPNWGPLLRCHGVRGSQLGDSVAALAVYAWLRQHAPDCYTMWQVARRHAHAAPLFYNHPDISQLYIGGNPDEGYGEHDRYLTNTAHVRLPLMPEHVCGEIWPNLRGFYAETFTMSGLPEALYNAMVPEVRRPRLSQWFAVERRVRTIAYWPCAAYGVVQTITLPDGRRMERSRNASRAWAQAMVDRLVAEGYTVLQCGHPRDYADCGGPLAGAEDLRGKMTFMEMVMVSLGTDAVLGTDSGAGIAIGAYGHPQVSLLTPHFPGHTTNLTAFEPDNPRNLSLVGADSADAITHDAVMAALKQVAS